QDLTERLHDESSGRNRFDIDQALRGIPLTPKERLEAAQRRIDWEKTAYFSGDAELRNEAAGFEYAEMERQYRIAEARYKRFEAVPARQGVRHPRAEDGPHHRRRRRARRRRHRGARRQVARDREGDRHRSRPEGGAQASRDPARREAVDRASCRGGGRAARP